MSVAVPDLIREVGLLVRRLRGWSGSSWDVPVGTGETRAERTARLLDELAALGERMGTGAPAGLRPPRLAPHALPDQVTVLSQDLATVFAATGVTEPPGRDVLPAALAAVTGARTDLDGAGFGFRPS